MKKALIVATVAGFVASFEYNDIQLLKSKGYEVHCAFKVTPGGNEEKKKMVYDNTIVHPIDFSRRPLSASNIRSYKQLKSLMKKEHFDFVHCHTPVGGVLGRLAAHRCKVPVIIYTAHGFHFYSGAPIKNWLIFYPIEKYYSRYTDVLITINKEDYKRAKEHFKAKRIVYIPGVGVDTEKFAQRSSGRQKIRTELEIKDNQIMLLSVGELNENKNHGTVIKAIAGMNLTYVIAGKGELDSYLEEVAKECGVDLRLMGYRSDVADIYDAADIYILPSIREGLNVSLMEAMASALPCLAGRIRGNVDLIEDDRCLFDPNSVVEIREAVVQMAKTERKDREKIGNYNLEKVRTFDLHSVEELTSEIYQVYEHL